MSQTTLSNQLNTAAFMMEGLRDFCATLDPTGYNALLSKYDGGCVEMVHQLTMYVPMAYKLLDAGLNTIPMPERDSIVGMFDYEVSSAFGHFWAKELYDNTTGKGELPDHDKCIAFLRDSIFAYLTENQDPTLKLPQHWKSHVFKALYDCKV